MAQDSAVSSTKQKSSRKSVIQRINDWLVSKVTKNKKYASVSYRYLCKQIERDLKAQESEANVIAVTFVSSIKPATELCMFLGFSLASELGGRIILVETLMKQKEGSLQDKLACEPQQNGFLQLASRAANTDNLSSLITKTAVETIDFLPSGANENTSSLILQKDAIDDLFATLRNDYDYIVLLQDDIRLDTRYLAVSGMANINLLLVEENRSFMHDVQESKQRFAEREVENLRLVMTT